MAELFRKNGGRSNALRTGPVVTRPEPRIVLDPEVERRLAGIRFHFPESMAGRLTGVHRSAQPGVSVEFSDHKEYSPGDDIRQLNWKVYARSDKFYVRQFAKDTHAAVCLVLDCSGSMFYRSEAVRVTKAEHAAGLALALCYLFLRQNDSVGLLAVRGSHMTDFVPPRSHASQLVTVQEHLDAAVTGKAASSDHHEGPTSLAEGLEFLVSRRTRRSAVIVLSDLFMELEEFLPYLRYLVAGGSHVWLVQVLDPSELDLHPGKSERTFPFQGAVFFRSAETGHGILMDARLARADYLARFNAYQDDLRERCAEAGIEFSPCNTDTAPSEFILEHLTRRR
ncbi:MAG: DUF58 domain-containing protein [Deltaproteobacteria bacterium]|nr:DUF58 domain-containing protein [Deltaproteobacteria bacterium]